MADKFDKPDKVSPNPAGPKKAAPAPSTNPRLADAQRRAQALASRKPTSGRQFFEEAWVELKKTSWPNRAVLTKSTTVVLALVVAVAIWVGFLDFILTRLGNVVFASH